MTAQTKIDYLAFTVPTGAHFNDGNDKSWELAFSLLDLHLSGVWSPVFTTGTWEVEQGRGVYQHSRVNDKSKVRLSVGNVNADIYVEVSGVACEIVRSMGIFYEIFQQENIRFSRIDLACDFECNYTVQQIIDKGYKKSIKSRADYRTVEGDTTYIGARKSERMLRVYRYHKPHPRHPFLRCEVELKGKSAKAIAPLLNENSCAELCLSALKVFELQHPMIKDAIGENSKLKSRPYDKARNGRMRWIMTQVLPALVKAHEEGDIDARVWCETHLFPLLK